MRWSACEFCHAIVHVVHVVHVIYVSLRKIISFHVYSSNKYNSAFDPPPAELTVLSFGMFISNYDTDTIVVLWRVAWIH